MTCGCGREIEPPREPIIVASGWCAPRESLYEWWPEEAPMCSDCRTRMLMVMLLGIDPGRDGENLRVTRGGIKYPSQEGK